MRISGARVFDGAGFSAREICVERGRIATAAGGERIDAAGLLAVPGFIDMHIHGIHGHDFCDGSECAIRGMAQQLIREGVTGFVPATMTVDEALLTRACRAAADHENRPGESEMLGVYLEGPFIAEGRRGAQNAQHIRLPDVDLVRRLQRASGGKIRVATVAPEQPGAMALIDALGGELVISIAHSDASYAVAAEAIRRGCSHVTHLFNAMPPFGHRESAIVGAAFDSEATVELIPDGNFVGETMMRAAFRLFSERVVLVSDGMRATGMPEGEYELGGQTYRVRDGVARMTADGALAGPVISLSACVRRLVTRFGIPMEDAVRAATLAPAKRLGIDGEYGKLEPGHWADVVLLDEDLNVRLVLKKGEVAFEA